MKHNYYEHAHRSATAILSHVHRISPGVETYTKRAVILPQRCLGIEMRPVPTSIHFKGFCTLQCQQLDCYQLIRGPQHRCRISGQTFTWSSPQKLLSLDHCRKTPLTFVGGPVVSKKIISKKHFVNLERHREQFLIMKLGGQTYSFA